MKYRIYVADSFACMMAISSILLLYHVYLQLKTFMFHAENMTFFQFLFTHNYKYIIQSIQIKLQDIVNENVKDLHSLAFQNCIPQTNVFSSNANSWLNIALNGIITSISTADTSACIMKTSQLYIEKTMFIQQNTIGLLIAQLNANARQVTNIVYYGLRIGTGSVLYLSYRIYPLTCLTLKRPLQINNE
jgi:hypothetical protein